MDASNPTFGALAKALAAAQATMPDAVKDGNNPHFKSRYATLAAVRAAVTPHLTAQGLAVTQTFEPAENGEPAVIVITTLMHTSGETILSRLSMPTKDRSAQAFGSAISYGRRYALAAICGIATDDDDDGAAAQPGPAQSDRRTPAPRQDVPPAAERAANSCAPSTTPPGQPAEKAAAFDKLEQRVNGAQQQAQPAQVKPYAQPAASAAPAELTKKRNDVGNLMLKYLSDIPNEDERKREAVKMLGALLPGKRSTSELSELDCDRIRLAIVLLGRVPGGTIKDVNAYLTGQWTMSPIPELSALEIQSAYNEMAKAAPPTGAPIADNDIPF